MALGEGIRYQWQYQKPGSSAWNNCGGAGNKTDSFSFKASTYYNGWQYRCVISNSCGTVYSAAAKLTVKTGGGKPVITEQPEDGLVSSGEYAVFSVKASGANLSYQWQYSRDQGYTWTNCGGTGSKTDTFSFRASTYYTSWMYRCVVSNSAGSVPSNAVRLNVDGLAAPFFSEQPEDQTVQAGQTVTFSALVTDSHVRWQYSRDGGKTWVNCSSAGSDTISFSFKATAYYNGWMYRLKAENVSGVSYSRPVTLTVT